MLLCVGIAWFVMQHARQPEPPAARTPAATPAAGDARQDNSNDPGALTAEERATAAALLPPGTALGPQDPDDGRCHRQRLEQARALRSRIDPGASPEAALTHALLARMSGSADNRWQGEALQSLELSSAHWPDNPDLARHRYLACLAVEGCDRQAALRTLERIDGRNAATWLLAINDAITRDDPQAARDALARAASADGYDSGMGAGFIALQPALARLPLPQACLDPTAQASLARELGRAPTQSDYASIQAMAIEMAIPMPALGALSICRGPDSKQVAQDCLRLLAHVAGADTFAERMVALRMLIDLEPDATTSAALREQYRRMLWLSENSAAAVSKIDGYLMRVWAEGEIPLLQQYAQSQGRWPPPADWLPSDPHRRAVILGTPRD